MFLYTKRRGRGSIKPKTKLNGNSKSPLDRRRNRPPQTPCDVPSSQRLRSNHAQQRGGCGGNPPQPSRRYRFPRRTNARPVGHGNPLQNQRKLPDPAGSHGHQERRRTNHGRSHRLQDFRLSPQARQPRPDPVGHQETTGIQTFGKRKIHRFLSAGIPGNRGFPFTQPQLQGMGGPL